MKNILITGAGGYIGSNAVEYFCKRGYNVIGMIHNRVAPRFSETGADAIHADLYDLDSLNRLFCKKYDYVIHIAALASDTGRKENFRKANFEAVKRLSELCLHHDVRRFVYLSTADVYGLHDFVGQCENKLTFDLKATNPYPYYKIRSEIYLSKNMPSERFSCVRPCVVFGNGDTTITPRAIEFLKNSPFVIHFGKWRGKNRWPLAHVKNVCRTLHGAMLLEEAGGKGVTVLDSKYTTLSGYYRDLMAEFLPQKKFKELSLPCWSILPAAVFSSLFSGEKPLFDPTLYALNTITHNLDFSNQRMLKWIHNIGEKEYICNSFS